MKLTENYILKFVFIHELAYPWCITFSWHILIFLSDFWPLVVLIESFTQSRQNSVPLSHVPSSFVFFNLETDSHYSALPGLEVTHTQNDLILWFPCFSLLSTCDYRHISPACWPLNLPTSALGSGEWAAYSSVYTTGITHVGQAECLKLLILRRWALIPSHHSQQLFQCLISVYY